jgi:hypothetical protein
MIPVPIHYRTSKSSQFPSPPLSTDSYHTPSVSDRPLTLPYTSISQHNYNREKKVNMLRLHSPDIVYQRKKEHNERMQRYDRLLEKIHATDEQLQALSRSWMNSTQQRTPVSNNYLFYQRVSINYKKRIF